MPLLQVTSVRELEDLIIDVMYAGLLGGRLDHQSGTLHIEWMAGRDVSKNEVEDMRSQLQNWFANLFPP
jgi:COP9 signalosome complex subunit 7